MEKAAHVRYAYPIVSAHRVEGIGATNENHLVVSWNKHFDEVVAFVLEKVTIMLLDCPHADVVGSSSEKTKSSRHLLYACLS